MAVEAKRGCGYRKVGGTYIVGGGSGVPCDRLPFHLSICPTCHHGFHQSRTWTWVDVAALVGGPHDNCVDSEPINSTSWGICPLCINPEKMGKAGLMWIGEQFYKTPTDFLREAAALGISRRVPAIPKGLKVGETWILLAHPKAVPCSDCQSTGLKPHPTDPETPEKCASCNGKGALPGIFRVFKPTAIEKIVTETQSKDKEAMEALAKKGITPVVVPDDDKDHQGRVYDKPKEETEAVAV